eukprot:161998_1
MPENFEIALEGKCPLQKALEGTTDNRIGPTGPAALLIPEYQLEPDPTTGQKPIDASADPNPKRIGPDDIISAAMQAAGVLTNEEEYVSLISRSCGSSDL